jgi:hypothetical protein
VGKLPASGPNGEFTFKDGEHLTGDLILCGNGIGTKTGYLGFSTNMGNKFSVGTMHTPYYYPTGNSFFMGIFG